MCDRVQYFSSRLKSVVFRTLRAMTARRIVVSKVAPTVLFGHAAGSADGNVLRVIEPTLTLLHFEVF